MKTILTLALALTVTSSAFALSELNCSNAEKTFSRDEKEIWGANLIKYYIDGELQNNVEEKFDGRTKHVISSKVDRNEKSGEEIYSIKMSLETADGKSKSDFVICRKWWNGAID